jgi:two-component system alkaline phosphatase synthesis response regulator PhoP
MSNIVLGNMTIDRSRYDVWVGERLVELTYVEFELLFALARNAGKVMSRARLIQAVWHESGGDDDRKLTVHMSRLRKKLAASDPWQIETYTKRGYALMNKQRASSSKERQSDMPHSTPPLGGVI